MKWPGSWIAAGSRFKRGLLELVSCGLAELVEVIDLLAHNIEVFAFDLAPNARVGFGLFYGLLQDP